MTSSKAEIEHPLRPVEETLAVVGCGSIGKRHISNLVRLGTRNIVAFDPREDRRREVERQFSVSTVAELDRALDGAVAALICSPTNLHLAHAYKAAAAGCHVFIEKPIAADMDGLPEFLKLLGERRLRSLIGCNFRFHPGMQQAKEALREGSIGKVVSARAHFGQYLPDWHPWEDYREGYSARASLGGGVILDRIHELDYVRWLLGEPTHVYAMSGHLSNLEIDTEDTVEILLRLASGCLASVHLDYVRRTYGCRLDITGEGGTIEWTFEQHCVGWYLAGEGSWHRQSWPLYDVNEMYLEEMRHFLDVITGRAESQQDAASAAAVLQIALAAKLSARSGQTVCL